MSRLVVAPIVEGHGEEAAIRTLVTRVWTELVRGTFVEVLPAVRQSRSKLVQRDGLLRAIELALLKITTRSSDDPSLILILFDADDDLPCVLAPALLQVVREERPHLDVAIVLANAEYETWFVAAAESLHVYLDVRPEDVPKDPEATGAKKAWVQERYRTTIRQPKAYSETIDQVRLTQGMNLQLCRSRSPSFDKLCRELANRLDASTHA